MFAAFWSVRSDGLSLTRIYLFEQSSGASFRSQQIEVLVVLVVLFIKNDSPDLSFFPTPFTDCTLLIDRPYLYGFEKAVLFDDEVV